MIGLIKQVVLSWQVIAVTVVLIIYLSLVFYVARLYHNPRRRSLSAPKKNKKSAPAAAPVQVAGDEDEELNLEEG
jgi:flagellar biosynthesis/type III secretory pathway M-ring protein FliF/YscJ